MGQSRVAISPRESRRLLGTMARGARGAALLDAMADVADDYFYARPSGRRRPMRIALRDSLYQWRLRSPRSLTLPDFLGIGAQKGGTSWLHANLAAHPGIFCSEPKELHYFDQYFDQGLERYADSFAKGAGRCKGEITPAYAILPESRVRFIRAVMPDIRLIFMMRNPIERAWSHAMMTLCWKVNRQPEQVSEAEYLEHFRGDASIGRGDYEAVLGRWLACFDRSQLFLGYFEQIASDPRALLRAVFTHLGVTADVDWSLFPLREVFYRGNGAPLPEHYRQILLEMYEPRLRRLRKVYDIAVEPWLRPRTAAVAAS